MVNLLNLCLDTIVLSANKGTRKSTALTYSTAKTIKSILDYAWKGDTAPGSRFESMP